MIKQLPKKLPIILSALVAIAALSITPNAEAWWGWHHPRYYHYWGVRPVVVGGPIVYGPPARVYYGGYYYTSHYNSIPADVQAALRNRGYYHGPIDGVIGAGSSRAIRHYQYDRGLPVTGTITRSLLRSLGL